MEAYTKWAQKPETKAKIAAAKQSAWADFTKQFPNADKTKFVAQTDIDNKWNITEPLPGVLGNKGTGAFIFREQGIFSNYFQGTRELLNRLLGTREHQSNLKGFFFNFPSPLNISSVGRDYCYDFFISFFFFNED